MSHGGEIKNEESSAGKAARDPLAQDPFALVTAEETPVIESISAPPLVATVGLQTPIENPIDTFSGIVEIPHPLAPPEEEPAEPAAAEQASDSATDADAKDRIAASATLAPTRGSGWTIPMLCAGIALIAMCVLLPLADENHQLVYQREKLKLDLAQIQRQVSVNNEFIKRVGDDPTLAERLAERQMRTIRQGTSILDLSDNPGGDPSAAVQASASSEAGSMSPFMLVTIPPPPAMAPYKPLGGVLSRFVGSAQRRLYTMGVGLFLMAAGLVLGAVPQLPWRARKSDPADDE